MKEAILYKKLADKRVYPVKSPTSRGAKQFNRVKCQNCAHYCVIEEGKRGICGVRENINGKLYALNYGKAIACNIDPIEKKPLFHFLPGTQSLSIATVGCNFRCANCQNWDISQGPKPNKPILGEDLSPREIVKIAKENNLPSIAYTYTSPTIFSEYALNTMKLAKEQGIKNIWISNGFWSKELFEMISPFLDAANIDLKGFSDDFYIKYCGGRVQPVLDTLERIKKKKIWLEVTTLVIPSLTDSKEMFENIANFIKNELDAETPWHISQFSGAISWKLQHLPDTPVKTLKMAYEIGKRAGLKYVYTGNVPGLESENTYCPKCGTLAIERLGYAIKRFDKNGKCSKCRGELDLILN
ncbi:AmmeMemoRadiSam system radical SAM enzyme [Candidatus Parcubacteria bacterium]|nr:AmmeMemoRadiSam system radical SAM enzyme [Candidatus Parcubacteria bacterium]